MTDLSNLSDDQLRALYGKQVTPATTDLSQLSDEDLKAAHAAVTARTDTSPLSALQQGAASIGQGVGATVKNLISKDAGKAIEAVAAAKAPKNYQSAGQEFANPSDGADNHFLGVDWRAAPRALLEQAPALATDLGAQMLLKRFGIVGQAAGGALSYGLRTAGNEIQKRADARTGQEGSEPNTEDKLIGVGSTGLQGALNSYGANKLLNPAKVTESGLKGVMQAGGNVVKGALAEGATSGAQAAISDAAATAGTDKGLTVDPQAVKAAALLGGISGGIVSSRPAAKEAITSLRFPDTPDEHTAMAANRIKVSGSVDTAKADVATELKRAASEVSNVSPETDNAIEAAKTGKKLSGDQLAAIDQAGNDTLSSLARQSSTLSSMSDEAGGLSGKAERFVKRHPIWALGGVASPHAAAAMGLDALLPGSGTLLAGAGLGYTGLRVLDSSLGLRSPGKTFADKFSTGSQVRPDAPLSPMTAAGVSVPQVTPQNSLTTPQPWGPVADKPTPFKPDMLDSNLQKIVDKIQNQKRRDTSQEMLPLLRQLAAQNQPAPEAPGMDVSGLNEQIKGAMLMASARRKIAGQQQAEAEADQSPMINEQGGLDALRNPAMGKRAQELISAANALARLRRQPEETEAPPISPEQPPQPVAPSPAPQSAMASILQRLHSSAAAPEAPQPSPTPPPAPEPFVLPTSKHVYKDPQTAARDIYADAVAGGKEIRNAEGYKAGTQRRLAGEEAIYNAISNSLNSVKERGDFHQYLEALWGSDSPEVVTKVREHMLSQFPQAAETINKYLSDEAIKGLWTKPKKKK